MNRMLSQDDTYWRQRAKVHWYRYGDRNTKIFHASAIARKKVNHILSFEDNSGNKISDNNSMCEVAKNYFVELFQKNYKTAVAPVTQVIRHFVSAEDNVALTAPFTKEEFREAMFSMHPDKCSRPDGYSPGFYQQFWSLCSDEIFKYCCNWLDTGSFLLDLNMTNIALIPKGNSQVSMKDWRPIALYNVLYKLVSKVFTNRLKLILHKCISDNQSAFIPNRSILDNAMVAIEVIHFMKTKTKVKDKFVDLKLNISKAYDKMDWEYLKEVMLKMSFSQKWI